MFSQFLWDFPIMHCFSVNSIKSSKWIAVYDSFIHKKQMYRNTKLINCIKFEKDPELVNRKRKYTIIWAIIYKINNKIIRNLQTYFLKSLNDFIHINDLRVVGIVGEIYTDSSDGVNRHCNWMEILTYRRNSYGNFREFVNPRNWGRWGCY